VELAYRTSALTARRAIEQGVHDPSRFRAALTSVPASARDAWLDLVLGLEELPADGPELPRGCVPYLPCPVDVLLRVIDHAGVDASDVFVDIGSGLGRATTLVHLLTGAGAIGLEIQSELAATARKIAARLSLERVPCIQGDAAALTSFVTVGTVFFLYCPFGGQHLQQVLDQLESIARTRMLRVCCVDLPLPACEWLKPDHELFTDLAIYRSTVHAQLG
jgi:SAM-dependent methyltransferase